MSIWVDHRHCLEKGGPFWLMDNFCPSTLMQARLFLHKGRLLVVLYILTVWTWFCYFGSARLEISTIQLPRVYKDTSHWQKQPKPRGLGVTVRHWCSFPIGYFPSDSPWCEQTAITSRIFPLCLGATNWSYEVLFSGDLSNLRLSPLNQPKVKPNQSLFSLKRCDETCVSAASVAAATPCRIKGMVSECPRFHSVIG